MKSRLLLCLLLPLWMVSSCDKPEALQSLSLDDLGDNNTPSSSKHQPKEVLEGSRELVERQLKQGREPLLLAHDTPPMETDATGVYSYVGSTKEFKTLCGFDLPDWVEPYKGEFSVSVRSSGPVRHATLEYKINPARRAEFEALVIDGWKRQHPERPTPIFVDDGIRLARFFSGPENGVEEAKSISLAEDGTVTLRCSRGPVGWDD